MADFIPKSQADFLTWLNNFATMVEKNKATLALDAATSDALKQVAAEYAAAVKDNDAKQAAAAAAQQTLATVRERAVTTARTVARIVQANPATTDADRAAYGLNIPGKSRGPAPVPTTHPVAQLDFSQRAQHTIDFYDQLTPHSRAKPGASTARRYATAWAARRPPIRAN